MSLYFSHKEALGALKAMWPVEWGYCKKCHQYARLKVCEGPPEGDQETYHIGTKCCEKPLKGE
jgi:hypothetical protein